MDIPAERPVVQVLVLFADWVKLDREGPEAAMRAVHHFKVIDLLEVEYYQSRGWMTLVADPNAVEAFYRWRDQNQGAA